MYRDSCLKATKGERGGERRGLRNTQLMLQLNDMDSLLLGRRQAQVLPTQREKGHSKVGLQKGRVHTAHLPSCLQHLPVLTSIRSIIS